MSITWYTIRKDALIAKKFWCNKGYNATMKKDGVCSKTGKPLYAVFTGTKTKTIKRPKPKK